MSIEAIAAVKLLKNIDSTHKWILMAIADYAGDTQISYPSLSTLADYTCLSRRTIITRIEELIKLGYLSKHVRVRKNGSHTSNYYKLLFLSNPIQSSVDQGGVVKHDHQGSEAASLGVVMELHPLNNNNINNIYNNNINNNTQGVKHDHYPSEAASLPHKQDVDLKGFCINSTKYWFERFVNIMQGTVYGASASAESSSLYMSFANACREYSVMPFKLVDLTQQHLERWQLLEDKFKDQKFNAPAVCGPTRWLKEGRFTQDLTIYDKLEEQLYAQNKSTTRNNKSARGAENLDGYLEQIRSG